MRKTDWTGPLTDTWPEAKAAQEAERVRLNSLFKSISVTGHHSYGEGEVKIVRTTLTVCTRCGVVVGDRKAHDDWHESGQP